MRPLLLLLLLVVAGCVPNCSVPDHTRCHRDLDADACARVCSSDNTEACVIFVHYRWGSSKAKDTAERACRWRDRRACTQRAFHCSKGGHWNPPLPPDEQACVLHYLERACKHGDCDLYHRWKAHRGGVPAPHDGWGGAAPATSFQVSPSPLSCV